MTTIAVFPGQGAQHVGMGADLCRTDPAARQVHEAVDAALGEALSTLAFRGPIERLTLTQNAQPALMATSVAAVRSLEAMLGRPLGQLVDYVAGHSLGEYAALAAVGSLDLAQAARLLRLRGQAMQRAVAEGQGAMAAILGLTAVEVEALALAAAGDHEVCELANDNSDGQAVVSGDRAAVMRAIALAKERGAKRALLLDVSAPFHCRLMQPAAAELAPALRAASFAPLPVPVIANVTAAPEQDVGRVPGLLERQVTGRVRWRESMVVMAALDVDLVIEFGAGKVLSGLLRRALPGARILSVQGPDDLAAAAAALTA